MNALILDIQPAASATEPLIRAIINSLFTWRRAYADDILPNDQRMGWWGDSFPVVPNDRIGSRLWLLSRSKVTEDTRRRAQVYAEEALQWLLEDGVASRIEATAIRTAPDTLRLHCRVYKTEDPKQPIDIRFNDVWKFLDV